MSVGTTLFTILPAGACRQEARRPPVSSAPMFGGHAYGEVRQNSAAHTPGQSNIGGQAVVTNALEQLVLPALKSELYTRGTYRSGMVLSFDWKTPQSTMHWLVVDHSNSQVLAIETAKLASVAPDDTAILKKVNAVNAACIGKFSIVDQDRLTYCLELPYTQASPPALFQHALFLALDTVVTHQERWQQAARVSLLGKDPHAAGLFDRMKDAFG
jgi:hypothetical protein